MDPRSDSQGFQYGSLWLVPLFVLLRFGLSPRPLLATYSTVEDFLRVKNKPQHYLFVGLHAVALLD